MVLICFLKFFLKIALDLFSEILICNFSYQEKSFLLSTLEVNSTNTFLLLLNALDLYSQFFLSATFINLRNHCVSLSFRLITQTLRTFLFNALDLLSENLILDFSVPYPFRLFLKPLSTSAKCLWFVSLSFHFCWMPSICVLLFWSANFLDLRNHSSFLRVTRLSFLHFLFQKKILSFHFSSDSRFLLFISEIMSVKAVFEDWGSSQKPSVARRRRRRYTDRKRLGHGGRKENKKTWN